VADKSKKRGRDIESTMERLADIIAAQVDHLETTSGALSPEGVSLLLQLVTAANGISRTKANEQKSTPRTLPKSKKSPDEILKTIEALSGED